MPSHPAVTGTIMVAGIALAAAIAIYESPQARQFASDVRRKIAIALYSLGDEINPERMGGRQTRFNRPEDADGFLKSTGGSVNCEMENEEAKRLQREKLLYLNSAKISQQKQDSGSDQNNSTSQIFSEPPYKNSAQEGKGVSQSQAVVYNSGADITQVITEQAVRHRSQKASVNDTIPIDDKHNNEKNDFASNETPTSFIELGDAQRQEAIITDCYTIKDVVPHNSTEKAILGQILEPEVTKDCKKLQDIYTSIHTWAESAHASNSIQNMSSGSHSSMQTGSCAGSPSLPLQQHHNSTNTIINDLFETSSIIHGADSPTSSCDGAGDLTTTDLDSFCVSSVNEEAFWEPNSPLGPSDDGLVDINSLNGDRSNTTETWTVLGSVTSDSSFIHMN